jgi:subtilisin family serine protease
LRNRAYHAGLRRPALLLVLPAALLAVIAGVGSAAAPRAGGGLVEVVVTLPPPPLALVRRGPLDLRSRRSSSYLHSLAATQQEFAAKLATAVPDAHVNWHYAVALDGVSVVVPASELPRLSAMPGATVWPTVTYHSLGASSLLTTQTGPDNRPPKLIGATTMWNQGGPLANAGQGLKIGILDDGVDEAHPYFASTGFSYPAGFPMGQTAYTTPKVIVARAFPSPSSTWKNQDKPFDPVYSDHGTHVAGIAAGDYDTPTDGYTGESQISGIAPKAYIGNYKIYTVPSDVGLDGNSPEVAKGIDQAVADGMNVINLSIGEPEVAPQRDIVVTALDNAAAAGVVPVVAAGNDFYDAGFGSVGSPGNAPAAITVAATTGGSAGDPANEIADFSSAGPTPISLIPKPDVAAPGVDVLSSTPGGWASWDGTSMSTPEVSGAAALLLQNHPTWTVADVKSALESTGVAVHAGRRETSTLREGGGRIDIPVANTPLLFTRPTALGWGLVRRGFAGDKSLATVDAGGGPSPWKVSVARQKLPVGAKLKPLAAGLVAGQTVKLRLTISKHALSGDGTGFVILKRGSDVRRVPFWFHVEVPKLQLDPHRTLTRPGTYRGNTAGGPSRVSRYLFPQFGLAAGVPTSLGGPEEVFQFRLRKPVANFGVAILSGSHHVSPRLVHNDDENRLDGYTGLPATLNPYGNYGNAAPVVGAVLPTPGVYDFVFDTPTGTRPGAFTFRFWINDTTPPTIRLLTPTVTAGKPIRLAVHDAGAGVDPNSVHASVGHSVYSSANGTLSIPTSKAATGRLKITVVAADYQELKNMEDIGPVRPNKRVFHAFVTIRR